MDTRGLLVSPEISGLPEVITWGNRSDKGHGEQALSTCKLMGRRLPFPKIPRQRRSWASGAPGLPCSACAPFLPCSPQWATGEPVLAGQVTAVLTWGGEGPDGTPALTLGLRLPV